MNFSRPHYLKPKLTTTPTSSCSHLSNNVSSNNVPSCCPASFPNTSPHALFHLQKKVSCLSKPLAPTTQEYRARCLLPALSSNNNSITEATPSLYFLEHTYSSLLYLLCSLPCLHSRTTLSTGYTFHLKILEQFVGRMDRILFLPFFFHFCSRGLRVV